MLQTRCQTSRWNVERIIAAITCCCLLRADIQTEVKLNHIINLSRALCLCGRGGGMKVQGRKKDISCFQSYFSILCLIFGSVCNIWGCAQSKLNSGLKSGVTMEIDCTNFRNTNFTVKKEIQSGSFLVSIHFGYFCLFLEQNYPFLKGLLWTGELCQKLVLTCFFVRLSAVLHQSTSIQDSLY